MTRRIVLSFPGCHRRGGVERIVFECARFFAGRGHEVTVLANEWETDTTEPGIRYEYVPMRKKPGFLYRSSYFASSSKIAKGLSYDVLNTHGCVCPFGGVLRVHSVHRDWLAQSALMRKRFSLNGIRQRFNPVHPILLKMEAQHFRDRRYRKVVALSNVVKEALNRYYDVPAEDVEVIPNGFAPLEFNPTVRASRRTEMRESLGLRPDHIALLFLANEIERKGFGTAVQAVARLKRKDIRLLVVGRIDRVRIEQIASQAGVLEQVIFCGPTKDVAGFHAAADLFVLPTQYEAFCLAILESLGSGLPVITSSVPGAGDAIIPGKNGSVIADPNSAEELSDALLPYLDSQYRESVSAGTPNTVQSYQWPVVLEKYEQILFRYGIE